MISKIQSYHLEKMALIYIRQSSQQQLHQNQESTKLQYELKSLAIKLGWHQENIKIIDSDLGKSGQSVDDRLGFQKLLAEIGLDRVGIVIGLEMSRLARSCKDWYGLIELCCIFRCLLADHDGVYDPSVYNDRLLLGLKGTMSEAELHIMKGRLYDGKINKAKRGQIFCHPPTGYIKLQSREVVFDPDEQVQSVIRLLFKKFREIGSINSLLQYFVENKIKLGFRSERIVNKNELEWRLPENSTLGNILHNPLYAGVYTFGRSVLDKRRKLKNKPYSGCVKIPREDWKVFIPNAVPAYITWNQFEENQKRLAKNASRYGKKGVLREGKSILRGLITCKKCNKKMNAIYSSKGFFQYQCSWEYKTRGGKYCQSFSGSNLDKLIEEEILKVIGPASIELTIRAQEEWSNQHDEIRKNWTQQLERVHFKVERAYRQFTLAEPENRLVVRQLEKYWETSLREEREIKNSFQEFEKNKVKPLTEEEIKMVKDLSSSIPKLWNSKSSSYKNKQMIAQSLIEKVEVLLVGNSNLLTAEIHWKGGNKVEYQIENRVGNYKKMYNYKILIERISKMRDQELTSKEIADNLNREGFHPAKNAQVFKDFNVREIIKVAGLKKNSHQLEKIRKVLKKNEWTASDIAEELDIPYQTIYQWIKKGKISARQIIDGKRQYPIIWADKNELKRISIKYLGNPQNRNKEIPYGQ